MLEALRLALPCWEFKEDPDPRFDVAGRLDGFYLSISWKTDSTLGFLTMATYRADYYTFKDNSELPNIIKGRLLSHARFKMKFNKRSADVEMAKRLIRTIKVHD